MAQQKNHAFYSYKQDEYGGSKNSCHTTDSCDVEPMNSPWAVYERPPSGREYCLAYMGRGTIFGIQRGSWDEVMDKWDDLVQPTPNKVIFDRATGYEQLRYATPAFRWQMLVDFREWCGFPNSDTLLPQNAILCAGAPGNRSIRTTPKMTVNDYNAVAQYVTASLNSLPDKCDGFSCPKSEYAGCVLRMAGHDFMDYKDGS
eukprot:UN23925